MDHLEIQRYFSNIVDDDKNMSNGIAAIKTLLLVLEKTKCKMLLNNFTKTSFDYIIFQLIPYKVSLIRLRKQSKCLEIVGSPLQLYVHHVSCSFASLHSHRRNWKIRLWTRSKQLCSIVVIASSRNCQTVEMSLPNMLLILLPMDV